MKVNISDKYKNILERKSMIVIYIFALFVISRLSYMLVYYRWTGDYHIGNFSPVYNRWDTGWYFNYASQIADNFSIIHGAPQSNGEWNIAFFPLFPAIMAAGMKLFGDSLNIVYIGMLVNSVFFCISEYYAYKYIMLTRKDVRVAYTYITFMSVGIYAFYFSAFYTEALFLMLLTMCFYFLKKEEYIKMGIAGVFLTLTRNVGVMFVFVVLVDRMSQFGFKNVVLHFWQFFKTNISNARLVLGTIMVPAGIFMYMLFQAVCYGDGFAFVHVQRAWGKNNYGIVQNLLDGVVRQFPMSFLGQMTLILIVVMLIVFVRQRRYEESVYSLIILMMSASSSLQSVPRYLIGCFVLVLGFSDEYVKLSRLSKVLIMSFVVIYELVLVREWLYGNGLLV